MQSVPPTGDSWLHEIKIDGWRCQLVKEGRRIHFFSRRGNDLHRRLSSFADAFQGLRAKSATIDGELTVAIPMAGRTSTGCLAPCDAESAT